MSSGKKKKTNRRSRHKKSRWQKTIPRSFLITAALLLIFTSLNIAASSSYKKVLDITAGRIDINTLILVKRKNPKVFQRLKECCMPQDLQKKLQDQENENRRLIKEYEKILEYSPQDWRIVKNLYILYKRIEDEKMIRFYENKLKELR